MGDELTTARENVLKVLKGEITPDNHPAFFEDDLLSFAVQKLEINDKSWLLGKLASPAFKKGCRERVIANLTIPEKYQLIQELI